MAKLKTIYRVELVQRASPTELIPRVRYIERNSLAEVRDLLVGELYTVRAVTVAEMRAMLMPLPGETPPTIERIPDAPKS